jgi:very-short-patch-repair endonuclease
MEERLVKFAKAMRRQPTSAEAVIWAALRGARLQGFKFKRQQPIGAYIADFVCFERGLVVEIDGGQHADDVSEDQARSNWLQGQGFRVLRFWNNEVIERKDDVLESIIRALREYPSPQPLSRKGRRA